MGLKRTIAPRAYPVTLDELKRHAEVVASDDDTKLTGYLAAATRAVEESLGKQLVVATYELTMDALPREIVLPRPPLVSVSSVTYVDTAGDTQTLTATYYTVDAASFIGRIVRAYQKVWPSVRGHTNDVVVTYVARYAVPFSVDDDTHVATFLGRNPVDGESAVVTVSGGTAAAIPTGLTAQQTYYVRDADGATCKFAASADGEAIEITAGSGTYYFGEVPFTARAAVLLLAAGMYRDREPDPAVQLLRNERIQDLVNLTGPVIEVK